MKIHTKKERIPYHRPYPLSDIDKMEVDARLREILKTGQYTNGKYVRQLEKEIQELYNIEHAVATSSCTQGLLLCVEYLASNDVIQLPAFNWWSDLYILELLKKKMQFIDIDPNTWLPKEHMHFHESLYVHTFGNVGKSHAEEVIYDASHCLGAKLKDVGLATVFSLAPTKVITSCEGGMVITNSPTLAEFVGEYRDKMCRMSEIHAVMGLQTLTHLEEVIKWKSTLYNYYRRHVPGHFQEVPFDSNYNTIGFLNTEKLIIPERIEIRQYYELVCGHEGLTNTKQVYEHMVCLPSYYGCPYEEIVKDIKDVNGL